MEQRTFQVGAMALALALLLRLVGGWMPEEQAVEKALIFLGTGRVAAQTQPEEDLTAEATAAPEPERMKALPVFGESQEALVQIQSAWTVDTLQLLQQPLQWDLRGEEPTVLILHTHATESYENPGTYVESSPYRTLDTDCNMVSVGQQVAQLLTQGGIRVIHDRTLYDYPSYNSAYSLAREGLQRHLQKNPSICLVLDLHRDAMEDETGGQKKQAVELDGRTAAKLMLVMGSDKGSLSYPNWEKNLSLAVKLQAQLEQAHPGLCRPIKLGTSRYNQDLSTGALLVEVGAAGNTHEEALYAAQLLAEGILALADGANP